MNTNNKIIEKLRNAGLRPTRQRVKISEVLFNTEKTFHFTINQLKKILENKKIEKISQATLYNTVHAFKKKGYLKEIPINSEQSYFDTNISDHHHFFDIDTNQLIDCSNEEIDSVNIKKNITGKPIRSVEVLVKVATDNQNQK